jgi:pSer/pThr/pTyr-binding forkhead associated (FHA) protein
MPAETRMLGVMKPLGGGDPIPLRKEELTIGRRPTCDIQLDFENVSGKHCVLKMINHVWHVRDLGSTNGTTVNGQKISNEHGLMPDDELGIATHYFSIDYDPISPVQTSKMVLEEEMVETRKRRSLLEMAGLATDDDRAGRRRPARAPQEHVERPSAEDSSFEDAIPDRFRDPAAPQGEPVADDDFFKLIEEDVKKPD